MGGLNQLPGAQWLTDSGPVCYIKTSANLLSRVFFWCRGHPRTVRRRDQGNYWEVRRGRGLASVGTWRRLVAHLNGVQGVGGSNPLVPTINKKGIPEVGNRGVAILFYQWYPHLGGGLGFIRAGPHRNPFLQKVPYNIFWHNQRVRSKFICISPGQGKVPSYP